MKKKTSKNKIKYGGMDIDMSSALDEDIERVKSIEVESIDDINMEREIIISLANDAGLYLSYHGAPAERYLDSEKLYGKLGDEDDLDNIIRFFQTNFCIVPEGFIYITMTHINYTLSADQDDETKFKKLFSNLFWGLDNILKDDDEIPYQIFFPGDIVYNQDLSFDKIDDNQFDFYHKNDRDYTLYEPVKYSLNGKEKIDISAIKNNILLNKIKGRTRTNITGYKNKPLSRCDISTATNTNGLFKEILPRFEGLWKEQRHLVVFAPFCNPTWESTTRKDFCPNLIIQIVRELILEKGLNNYKNFKSYLDRSVENWEEWKKDEELSTISSIIDESFETHSTDIEFLKNITGRFKYQEHNKNSMLKNGTLVNTPDGQGVIVKSHIYNTRSNDSKYTIELINDSRRVTFSWNDVTEEQVGLYQPEESTLKEYKDSEESKRKTYIEEEMRFNNRRSERNGEKCILEPHFIDAILENDVNGIFSIIRDYLKTQVDYTVRIGNFGRGKYTKKKRKFSLSNKKKKNIYSRKKIYYI